MLLGFSENIFREVCRKCVRQFTFFLNYNGNKEVFKKNLITYKQFGFSANITIELLLDANIFSQKFWFEKV